MQTQKPLLTSKKRARVPPIGGVGDTRVKGEKKIKKKPANTRRSSWMRHTKNIPKKTLKKKKSIVNQPKRVYWERGTKEPPSDTQKQTPGH